MSEWQPIEAAPKDGTAILATNTELKQMGIVIYNSQGEWELVDPYRGEYLGVGFYPKHWLPIPLPPTTGDKEG